MKYRFDHVACGGTFDILHKGHTYLLKKAFKTGQQVSIGITSDKFCKELGKTAFESQRIRRKNLIAYLNLKRLQNRTKIIWLHDIYGSTAKDKTIQAIVVSGETIYGANLINKKRAKFNLNQLAVVVCQQAKAKDCKKISTGRIKNGEISKNGDVYTDLLFKIAGIRFSDQIRTRLKKPFGKIINISKKYRFARPLIVVGDITAQSLLKNKIAPDLSIVDFFVNRQKAFVNLSQLGFTQPNPDHIVLNEPGQISKKLIETIKKAIDAKSVRQIILVKGEEDLAFIPALLLSKIPATVVYGQPGRGIVKVDVTPRTKDQLCSLLSLT